MKVFIIAEIGINHNGDMKICKQLIDEAVNANCDAVKFQKRTLSKVYSEEELKSLRESPFEKHFMIKKVLSLKQSNIMKLMNTVKKTYNGLLWLGI